MPNGAMGRRDVRLPRPGTITLFAALDMATVIAQCRWHHRHQEYRDFLRKIEKNVFWELDVHVIVDHDATHKHPCVKHWLAARPRFHVALHPNLCLLAEPGRNLVQPDQLRERFGEEPSTV